MHITRHTHTRMHTHTYNKYARTHAVECIENRCDGSKSLTVFPTVSMMPILPISHFECFRYHCENRQDRHNRHLQSTAQTHENTHDGWLLIRPPLDIYLLHRAMFVVNLADNRHPKKTHTNWF